MKRWLILGLAALAVGACADNEPVGVTPDFGRHLPPAGARGITVMTRNVYLGADLDPLVNAPSAAQIPFLAAEAFAQVRATNFPERAAGLAAEIAAARPHLIGLQEVERYRVQSPGDAIIGGTTPATTDFLDFLPLLLNAIAARGLVYTPVVIQENQDVELPVFTGIDPGTGQPTFDDIRLTDREVILARSDVPTSDPAGANYAVNLSVTVGGAVPVTILRGWTSVVAQVEGNVFRLVNTHLETQVAPPIQLAQAQELLGMLAPETRPVILVGDFNSAADGSQTATYGVIAASGFVDAWAQKHPRDPGYTCCHASDLISPLPTLDQRLDVVWLRNQFTDRTGRIVGGVHLDILGEASSDRTPSGLWPSDHAGVVATLHLPPLVAWR